MRFGWKPGLLALLGLLVVAAAAAAQGSPIRGEFTLVAERSDNVEQAINRTITGMNLVTRQVARRRLRATNEPHRTIVISPTPSTVSISVDDAAPIVTPADGRTIRWRREDGEVFDVSTAWEGGSLRQSFAADDGRRVNRYTLSPDGNTLTLQVTVSSERLREPLTYRLIYRRERA